MQKLKINVLTIISALILMIPVINLHQTVVYSQVSEDNLEYYQEGYASWYGPGFHGRKTASGERFNTYELTAAHKNLPFGTLVKVTNLNNDKSIIVRINDRGPYVRGRVIDLSYASKQELEMGGLARVKLEIYREEVIDSPSDLSESAEPVNLFEETYPNSTKVFIEFQSDEENIPEEEFNKIFNYFNKIKIKVISNNPEVTRNNIYQEITDNSELNFYDITSRIKLIKGYTILLGEFNNKSDANELIGKIESLNIEPLFFEEILNQDSTSYKVYVGNYMTQRDSNDDRKLLEKMNFDTKLIKISN